MENKQDILRDPIWQFISVVVGIVAIFIGFLTLPASAQGIALVGITITCVFLILIFARKIVGLSLLATLFFFIGSIWAFLISGLTYYQIPLFTGNFGLDAPGVVYAKSDIGLALLVIEYVLWSIALLLWLLVCLIKKDYTAMLGILFIFIFGLFGSIPSLYMPNFVYIKLLVIDWFRPKTILGAIVCFLGILGLVLLFIAPANKEKS